jgi:ribonuclease HI
MTKTSNKGAVGVVCRDHSGDYMGASDVVFEGVTNPRCLEAMACREALSLVADLHVGDILVASDCMDIVKGLHRENRGIFGHILQEVKETSRIRGGVAFSP